MDKFNSSKKIVNFISAVICRVTWKTIQCIMVRKQIWLKYCVILTHFTVTLGHLNWNTILLHSWVPYRTFTCDPSYSKQVNCWCELLHIRYHAVRHFKTSSLSYFQIVFRVIFIVAPCILMYVEFTHQQKTFINVKNMLKFTFHTRRIVESHC